MISMSCAARGVRLECNPLIQLTIRQLIDINTRMWYAGLSLIQTTLRSHESEEPKWKE